MNGAARSLSSTWSEGLQIVGPVMTKHGFRYHEIGSGRGSGGNFISGEYLSGWKSLELHLRYSLGLVTYRLRDLSLSHEDYMRFLGVHRECKYPSFSEDALQGFRDLAHDLEAYCSDFLQGDALQFAQFARELQHNPNRFKGLPD